MSSEVRELKPTVLWNHFEDLNAVPRPSKKEERVIQFIVDFGNSLGLETGKDDAGNIVIRKPATRGMENKKGVVLQSHIDMVHQKNSDTDFDFNSEGIRSFIEGEWVTADGTTLGADNGIGVAAAMSVLSSNDLEHGPIEALFTIDEETGMTGAFALQPGFLKGDILLNMDTEDEGELTIGCAGGVDTNISFNYNTEPATGTAKKIIIKGLKGGHSGVDILLQRANANKLMTRFIYELSKNTDIRLINFDGGSLRNAIPREAFAEVTISDVSSMESFLIEFLETIKNEYGKTDPDLSIYLEDTTADSMLTADSHSKLINALYACPNGVYMMNKDVEGLVETSNNLSRVITENSVATIQCLTRGSVDSLKFDHANQIRSCFELIGANVIQDGAYPGWAPNTNSDILEITKKLFKEQFGYDAEIMAIHAGLECGIIGKSHPHLDMISFGPTIKDPHSPDERVEIATVERFWIYLLNILKAIPNK